MLVTEREHRVAIHLSPRASVRNGLLDSTPLTQYGSTQCETPLNTRYFRIAANGGSGSKADRQQEQAHLRHGPTLSH